ncbi:hypothetical protein GGR50DRAFT_642007, partial [Xylaria sp. CBS 124048]
MVFRRMELVEFRIRAFLPLFFLFFFCIEAGWCEFRENLPHYFLTLFVDLYYYLFRSIQCHSV